MTDRPVRTADAILATFGHPDLAAHDYIDSSLTVDGGPPDLASAAYMQRLFEASGDLLAQLDHASHELSKRLETRAHQLATSGNRLNYDVSLLKGELAGLHSAVNDDAQPRIGQLAAEIARDDTIVELDKLDKVKQGLEAVIALFDEAESFDETKITGEVNVLMERRDFRGALAILDRVHEVCKVWQGTNVYPRRAQWLAALRNRLLEAMNATEALKAVTGNANVNARATNTSAPITPTNTPRVDSPRTAEKDSYYSIFGQLGRKIGY